MKYVTKTTALIIIFALFVSLLFVPENWQGTYLSASLALLSFLAAILVYRFKCVQLIAGVEKNNNKHVDKQARYGGILLFIIALMSAITMLITIFFKEFSDSVYMIIFAIPIIAAIPYCLYKMNT